MDFDHVKGKKVDNISNMARIGRGINEIKKEIKKCEILCSNCHRMRTWNKMDKTNKTFLGVA